MIATRVARNLRVFGMLLFFYCGIYGARFPLNGLARMWNQNGGFGFRQEKFGYNPNHQSPKVKESNDINGVATRMAKENGKMDGIDI